VPRTMDVKKYCALHHFPLSRPQARGFLLRVRPDVFFFVFFPFGAFLSACLNWATSARRAAT